MITLSIKARLCLLTALWWSNLKICWSLPFPSDYFWCGGIWLGSARRHRDPVVQCERCGEAFPAHSEACAVLTALLRVLSSGELMRELLSNETLINSASIRLSTAAPLRPQWSTVFPHTNTFCGDFRASCSANICFPKWFCYRAPLAHSGAGSGLGPLRLSSTTQSVDAGWRLSRWISYLHSRQTVRVAVVTLRWIGAHYLPQSC